jgi:uncharacterized protein (DUF1778 family)
MRRAEAKGGATPADEQVTFNARLPKRVKTTLQRAAELRGQSLSDFILGTAYDRAVQTISAENLVQLSERDFSAFTLALIQPAIVDDTVAARFLEAHRRAAR